MRRIKSCCFYSIWYSWQKNTGSGWVNIENNDIYSGFDNDTLLISDATGLLYTEFRCIIGNNYGTESSETAMIINDKTPPVPDVLVLPDIIEDCAIYSLIPPTATDECEGQIIGTTDEIFPITSSTTVIWTFEDSYGNLSFIQQDIITNGTLGIEHDLAGIFKNEITIYPNPVSEIINLEFTNSNIKKLIISDITGKKLFEKIEMQNKEQVDLASFESGIYTVSYTHLTLPTKRIV